MTADAVGGVWTYALDLAASLAEQRIEVILAVMGPQPTPEQHAKASCIPRLEILEAPFQLEWMPEPWADLPEAGEWLMKLEQAYQPDVVHLNGYCHAALNWRAPVLVVAHSCVLSWWLAVKGCPAPPEWDRYRSLVAQGLRAADMVVAPSSAMLSSLDHLYGSLSATMVIPNGRSPGVFAPGKKEPIVFAAGRLWDEAKNLSALDCVAPQLSWPVYVAGNRNHPDGRTWEGKSLRCLGALGASALADWMARASVFALPALYEPFGLSVLEAALSSCALVLGAIPSLQENWSDAAIFVPPHDLRALHCAIEGLIANQELRQSLGAQARARALKFDPERMVREYQNVYGRIACA